MTGSNGKDPMESVNAVCQRAGHDAELKAALLADPRGTLERETGIVIPAGWELAAVESAGGSVSVELANDEIPEEYLALVTGGVPHPDDESDGGGSLC